MLKRLWQGPALQGSRLVERAGVLFEERQIMLRIEDELAATVDAGMTGDLVHAADDRHMVDETLHQAVTKTMRRRHGIICHAIAPQRGRGDLARALVAGLEGHLWQGAQDYLIRDEPFADPLLMAASAFILAGAAALLEHGAQCPERRRLRHTSEEVRPGILY